MNATAHDEKATPLPPEEKFWERYSPYNELPLSGLGSLTLHLLVLGTLGLLAIGVINFRPADRRMTITTVPYPPNINPSQGQVGPADSELNPIESTGLVPRRETGLSLRPSIELPIAPQQAHQLLPFPYPTKEPLPPLPKLPKVDARGGTGSAGLPSSVTKAGQPIGPSQGGDKPTKQQERMARWSLMLDTTSGADYLAQLRSLGAFLAIPDGSGYKLVRDLSQRPPVLSDGDLSSIQRLWWRDERSESVRSLLAALDLNLPANHFIAFMPLELETRLARLELAHAAKTGLKENQIQATDFGVRRTPLGFEPFVRSQTKKP